MPDAQTFTAAPLSGCTLVEFIVWTLAPPMEAEDI